LGQVTTEAMVGNDTGWNGDRRPLTTLSTYSLLLNPSLPMALSPPVCSHRRSVLRSVGEIIFNAGSCYEPLIKMRAVVTSSW
jgi:hypothetical protein